MIQCYPDNTLHTDRQMAIHRLLSWDTNEICIQTFNAADSSAVGIFTHAQFKRLIFRKKLNHATELRITSVNFHANKNCNLGLFLINVTTDKINHLQHVCRPTACQHTVPVFQCAPPLTTWKFLKFLVRHHLSDKNLCRCEVHDQGDLRATPALHWSD
jgi:hypothetical protein